MNRYRRELQEAFPEARIDKTRGGHYRLRLPNGRFVIVSATTKCRRVIPNTRRLVDRETRCSPVPYHKQANKSIGKRAK